MTTRIRLLKIRIIRRALQLLKDCKVPRFSISSSDDDPAELDRQQQAWSPQLVPLLTRLVPFLERHRETLFKQDWGPMTSQFLKHFILIYFEHMGSWFERAEYQPDEEFIYEQEIRLEEFEEEVSSALSKESNWGLRNWLFHRYGCVLGEVEGWQNHPAEIYGFVRFLLKITAQQEVSVDSNVLSFAETFGLRLLRERRNESYQMLGIRLLNASMRYVHNRNHSYTSNAEEILELALRRVRKQVPQTGMDLLKLFDVVYYAFRAMRVPNPSLDDEVMRTLVSLLFEDDASPWSWMSAVCFKTLAQILLLEVPEVLIESWHYSTFTISGQVTNDVKFRSYFLERYQLPLDGRISIRWKFRIGLLIPKLIGRIVSFSDELWLFKGDDLKAVGVLAWLVMFPIGKSWRQKCARLEMWCGMLEELFTGLTGLLRIVLDRQDMPNGLTPDSLQNLQVIFKDVVVLLRTIMDGARKVFEECDAALNLRQPRLTRHLTRFSAMVDRLQLRVTGVQRVIQELVIIPSQLHNQ